MQIKQVWLVLLVALVCMFQLSDAAYITLKYISNDTTNKAAVQKAFKKAAATWSKIIKTSQTPITFSSATSMKSYCSVDYTFSAGSKVKNLVIFVTLTSIDGVGNVLGEAGPCAYTTKNGYTYPRLGTMTLDSADVDSMVTKGTLQQVITHEMGHVLGFGTLWSNNDLTSGSSSITYTGEYGVEGYIDVGGSSSASAVPVQSTGSSGTKGSHWDETTFANELMTGWLSSSSSNPLSKLTVNSMRDLGYTVKLSAAQSYSLASSKSLALDSLTVGTGENTTDVTNSSNSTNSNSTDTHAMDISFEGDHKMVNRSVPVPVFIDEKGTIEYRTIEKPSKWEIAVTTVAAFLGAALLIVTVVLVLYCRKVRQIKKGQQEEEEDRTQDVESVTATKPVEAKCVTANNEENPATPASIMEAV